MIEQKGGVEKLLVRLLIKFQGCSVTNSRGGQGGVTQVPKWVGRESHQFARLRVIITISGVRRYCH